MKKNPIPKALQMIDLKAVLRRQGIIDKMLANQEMKAAARPLAEQMIKSRRKPVVVKVEAPRHEQFTNEQLHDYWEKQIHIVDVLEKRFDTKLQQFIGKIVDGFLSHLESEIATTKSMANKDKDYFSDNTDELLAQAQLDFTPLLVDQAVLAGKQALDLINSEDVYTPFALRKQIAENVELFTQSMLETDRNTLIDIVTEGIRAGNSVAEIRGSIQTSFESLTKAQAQRITRTEVMRVSNQAALDAWEQSGVVEAKQWLTAGAVDECAQYEGKIETLGGKFYDDTTEFADGDPPLHPNCRCVVVPVLVGEKGFVPQPNKDLQARIVELEAQMDKRTKAYKELQSLRSDDAVYIKSLEKHLKLDDE